MTIDLAKVQDAKGIHKVLMENLVEIEDFDKISHEERKRLENSGFLRKKVDAEYYKNLIEDSMVNVYIVKNKSKEIIAFATFHRNKSNIKTFRSTLLNLYADSELTRELLTSSQKKFSYLDQISIIPQYQRRGIGTTLLKKALEELNDPIVSFIVKVPLANKASAYWHEQNGFKLEATCDGEYKDTIFEWWIYIHWNKAELN